MIDRNQFTDEKVEAFALSVLMARPDKLFSTALSEADFSEQNAEIYKNLYGLAVQDKYDPYAFIASFPEGKREYVEVLLDLTPSHSVIETYAEYLKDLTGKRRIIDGMSQIHTVLMNDTKTMTDVLEVVSEMAGTSQETPLLVDSLVTNQVIFDKLDKPANVYSTGYHNLDAAMGGGLYEGRVYGFCGPEKAGKTTLAQSVSYNLRELGTRHLYVAMEMGSEQIEERNIARQLGFNSLCFLDKRDMVKEKMSKTEWKTGTIYLDAPGMTLPEIFRYILISKAKYGIKGFFLDYLGLVEGQAKSQIEEQFLRKTSQDVANFCKKHNLWCFLLSQMNQDGKLFGGNGLRKACDQLYMIRFTDEKLAPKERWLEMDVTRYTPRGNLGGEHKPAFVLNHKAGPFFVEAA